VGRDRGRRPPGIRLGLLPLRAAPTGPPVWIAWWCLYTVAIRVLIVWIYNNTGRSVFAAALFHATTNLTWQLFPNQGSCWGPAVTGPILALAAAIVTFLWGPKTLARFRYGARQG
jgi:uncharacterized protein